MSERDLTRLAIIGAVIVAALYLLKNQGVSIRNLGGTPIGGTPNIGGRGGL